MRQILNRLNRPATLADALVWLVIAPPVAAPFIALMFGA